MSIATVVTRGFGSFGRTQALARRGFAAFVALAEPPATGKQYIDVDLSGGLPSISLLAGADAFTGDVLVEPLVTDRGYTLTPRADGTFIDASGGDASADHFLYALLRAASGTLEADADAYINNQPPQFTTARVVYTFARNVAITPVDLKPNFIDPEGQLVTVTQVDGPVNFSIVGSSLTGTSLNEDRIDSLTMRGTDPATGFSDGTATLITGDVLIPPVKGLTLDGGESLLQSGFLAYAVGAGFFSDDTEAGLIAATAPEANTRVAPFSTVTLYPSLGLTVTLPVTGQAYPTRRQKRNTTREEQDAEDRERLATEVRAAAAAERVAAQMRADAEKNAAKQIRIQTILPAKFRGRR